MLSFMKHTFASIIGLQPEADKNYSKAKVGSAKYVNRTRGVLIGVQWASKIFD